MNSSLNKNITKKAFTVAEMMIAMMIAMIVIAAATPIMTKRGFSSFSLNTLPIGTITAWASNNATLPPNWCLCNGNTIDQKSYPDLYNMLGTGYDPTGTNTNHVFPDLRGRTLAGGDPAGSRLKSNNTVGSYGGSAKPKLTDPNQLPLHNHTIVIGDSVHGNSIDANKNHGPTSATSTGTHNHGGVTGTYIVTHTHTTLPEASHTHTMYYNTPAVLASISGVGTVWGAYNAWISGWATVNYVSGGGVTASSSGTNHYHNNGATLGGDHTHILPDDGTNGGEHVHTLSIAGAHNHGGFTQNTGSGTPFSVVKPYIVMQYIIKCK